MGLVAEAGPVVAAVFDDALPPTAVAFELPEFPPPAASTVSMLPVVVLAPTWPVASPRPVRLRTLPELATVVLLVPLPFVTDVLARRMPSPVEAPL